MTSGFNFDLSIAVDIRFGRGRRAEAGSLLHARGARSVLLVTDPVLAATQTLDGIRASLEDAGVRSAVFTEVEANPRVDQVDRGVQAAQDVHADAVVGAGGGSSMDVARAIGVLCKNPGPISRYDGGAPGRRVAADAMRSPNVRANPVAMSPEALEDLLDQVIDAGVEK